MTASINNDQSIYLDDIIQISEGATPAVNLNTDRNNNQKIRGYIPTSTTIELLSSLSSAITGGNLQNRVRYLYGPYGGGKSHLALVLQHLMRFGSNSPELIPLWDKMLGGDEKSRQVVVSFKEAWAFLDDTKGFLAVTLQADEGHFRKAMLRSLHRAVELELGAEIVKTLQPDNIYSSAIKQIRAWEQDYPNHYQRLEKNTDIEELVTALELFDHEAYLQFCKSYIEITGGVEFDPHTFSKTHEVYNFVAEQLRYYGYAGIIVIHDEFGNFLERAISDEVSGNSLSGANRFNEGIEFQQFAENCFSDNGNQIHFLMCAHLAPGDYAERSRADETVRQTWEKYFGRSQQTRITSLGAGKEMYQLLDGVIIQKPKAWDSFLANGAKQSLENISREARNLDFFPAQNWQLDDIIKTIVHGCYPLHPVTLYVLPRLSLLLGQNERTMFTFVSSNDSGTLGDYVEHTPVFTPEQFPIYTADKLFEYFEASLDDNKWRKQRDWYRQAVYDAGGASADTLSLQLIKLVMLWQIIKESAVVQLTVNRVKFALNLPDVALLDKVITDLQSKGILYVGRESIISPFGTDRASLEDEISDTILKIRNTHRSGSFLTNKNGKLLSSILRIDDVAPASYQRDFGLVRTFQAGYVVPSDITLDMVNTRTSRQRNKSGFTNPWQQLMIPLEDEDAPAGLLLYVLPQSSTELEAARSAAVSHLKHPRVLVVLPVKPLSVFEKTLRLDAVLTLMQKIDPIEDEGLWLRLHDKMSETVSELENILGSILRFTDGSSQVEIYCDGVKLQQPIISLADLENFVDGILRQTYHYEVFINDEVFGQRKGSGQATSTRKTVLRDIFNFQNLPSTKRESFGYSETSMDRRLVRVVLAAHGILRQENKEWILARPVSPTENNLRIIWDEIYNFFFSDEGKTKAIAPLITKLTEPPFGIYRQMLPIYIACAIRQQVKQLHFSDSKSTLGEVLGGFVDDLVKDPDKYKVKWVSIKSGYKALIELVLHELAPQGSFTNVTPELLADEVQSYYESLPVCCKETNNLPTKLKEFRGWLASTNKVQSTLLVENLITVLEAQSAVANYATGELGQLNFVQKKFRTYLTELNQLFSRIKQEAVQQLYNGLVELVGQTPPEQEAGILPALNEFFETRNQDHLKGYFRIPGVEELFQAIKNKQNLEQLTSTLAIIWTRKNIDEWDDLLAQRFASQVTNVTSMLKALDVAALPTISEVSAEVAVSETQTFVEQPFVTIEKPRPRTIRIIEDAVDVAFEYQPVTDNKPAETQSLSIQTEATEAAVEQTVEQISKVPVNSIEPIVEHPSQETVVVDSSSPKIFPETESVPPSPEKQSNLLPAQPQDNIKVSEEGESVSSVLPSIEQKSRRVKIGVTIEDKTVIYNILSSHLQPSVLRLKGNLKSDVLNLLKSYKLNNPGGLYLLTQILGEYLITIERIEKLKLDEANSSNAPVKGQKVTSANSDPWQEYRNAYQSQRWEDAIFWIEQIPSNHPNYELVATQRQGLERELVFQKVPQLRNLYFQLATLRSNKQWTEFSLVFTQIKSQYHSHYPEQELPKFLRQLEETVLQEMQE
jgi:hypothetical protein